MVPDNKSKHNAEELLNMSLSAGDLSQSSFNGIMGLNLANQLQQAIGMSVEDNDSVEPYLLAIVLDDSSSIAWINGKAKTVGHPEEDLRGEGPKAMIDGRTMFLDTLDTSKRRSGIMAATWTLNRGLVHGWMTLNQIKDRGLWEMRLPTDAEIREINDSYGDSIKDLDPTVFVAWGGTPLYDRIIEATVSLILKRTEYAEDCGVEAQGTVFANSDGADRGSKADPAMARDEFNRAGVEIMFPIFMGIQNPYEYTAFQKTADKLGIPKNFVFECDATSRAQIMAVFKTATDTALAASQSAQSFSETALGGFTN